MPGPEISKYMKATCSTFSFEFTEAIVSCQNPNTSNDPTEGEIAKSIFVYTIEECIRRGGAVVIMLPEVRVLAEAWMNIPWIHVPTVSVGRSSECGYVVKVFDRNTKLCTTNNVDRFLTWNICISQALDLYSAVVNQSRVGDRFPVSRSVGRQAWVSGLLDAAPVRARPLC